jgi:hypothetical protein
MYKIAAVSKLFNLFHFLIRSACVQQLASEAEEAMRDGGSR